MSLRRLDVEQIDLYQLHRIDPAVPLEDQIGELKDLQDEGKIRHLGLSEVTRRRARGGPGDRPDRQRPEPLQPRPTASPRRSSTTAEAEGIAFIPWFPIATGPLARAGGPLDALAARTGHTPAQLALAWLLRRSPVMLPIPGTGSLDHLEENVAGAEVVLDDDVFAELSDLTKA